MPSCFDELCLVEPSPMARRLLWHVLSVGSVWRDELESHAAQDKAGAFLFWVKSGQGQLQIGRMSWELSPGTRCWLVDLSTPRSYVPDLGQKLMTTGIRFSGPALDTWLTAMSQGEEFDFGRTAEAARIHREQARIQDLVTRRPALFEWEVHLSLNTILGSLLTLRNILDPETSKAAPSPVKRVLNAVLEDPLRDWRAAELAQTARISYSGLRAIFRESQEESLSTFLQRTRLHQARMLLANEGLSIKEIAAKAHFSSVFYFSKWFRRQTGLSPTQFRQSLRH
ncbi:helix-turn-helix transcriptional regulator [Planctomicrobium sp. SH661]|uniref:helix-turn-helix transcriptional regulator n=1 Tax=Planctomicrobium sp. SH661 TaxID=3448124 RepID=UPI003F5C8EAB